MPDFPQAITAIDYEGNPLMYSERNTHWSKRFLFAIYSHD